MRNALQCLHAYGSWGEGLRLRNRAWGFGSVSRSWVFMMVFPDWPWLHSATQGSEDSPHPWHLKTCNWIPLDFATRWGNWAGEQFGIQTSDPLIMVLLCQSSTPEPYLWIKLYILNHFNSFRPDALLALWLSSHLMSTWPRINIEESCCVTVTTVLWWVGVTFLTDEIEYKGNIEFFWLQINRAGVWGICTVLFTQATWEQWGPLQSSHW